MYTYMEKLYDWMKNGDWMYTHMEKLYDWMTMEIGCTWRNTQRSH